MNIQQAAVAFHAAARAAFTIAKWGPAAAQYRARAQRPQIGDMVIEISSFRTDDPAATGTLLMANPGEGVWRVLTFDGHGVTWENAEFVAAPATGNAEFVEAPTTETERREITRRLL